MRVGIKHVRICNGVCLGSEMDIQVHIDCHEAVNAHGVFSYIIWCHTKVIPGECSDQSGGN